MQHRFKGLPRFYYKDTFRVEIQAFRRVNSKSSYVLQKLPTKISPKGITKIARCAVTIAIISYILKISIFPGAYLEPS